MKIHRQKDGQMRTFGKWSSNELKAEDYIHKCFPCPYKRQSSMLCFFTNTCEVKLQVKRAIEKAILHKLPIYWIQVLELSLHIICHDLLFVFQLW